MISLAENMSFFSAEWRLLKAYLEELRTVRVQQLIGSSSHDDSMKLRGSIILIDSILKEEEVARKATTPRT